MSFKYDKLWKLLIDKNMRKKDLQIAINTTPSTIAKMGKNKNVNMKILDDICTYFCCDIGDIIEHEDD
ncbi:hypothetical protein HMPREF9225_0450 [Peptoniphilus duerdenii ATCC BAA-1640]|uniref:HTH cro/C1-type domain-containing protein n=1 Tax=Peptoniphilus duerdenii ATCC BAA-1640 TaxID=862517 RepID=E0NJW1_9FIRM|nr:helix-turn-helix transcriptional regulator [Peptoniphilus duerdenii]EFM25906.1 hypothetical protein HMPREF9225_0450 [Peptoniphilus duerdenii ATCC BAA-1640]